MRCYKDRQFCQFWEKCAHGDTCPRALTKDVQGKAMEMNLPIDMNTVEPMCFTEKEEKVSE